MRWLLSQIAILCFLRTLATTSPGQPSFLLSGSRHIAPGSPLIRTFQSPNGLYRLTLDQVNGTAPRQVPDTVELLAVVTRVDDDSQKAKWSRRIQGTQVQFIMDFEVAVSDDGDFFVLLEKSGTILSIFPKEKAPRRFASSWQTSPLPAGTFNTSELTELNRTLADSLFRSRPEILFRIEKLDGQQIVAFWWRDENTWEACLAVDGTKIPVSKELRERFDSNTRKEIVETLERAKNATLLKSVGKLSKAVSLITTNIIPDVKKGEIREMQYEFLTALHSSNDRGWIAELLKPKDEVARARRSYNPFFKPRRNSDAYCDVVDPDRIIGDWLLAVWDGKIKNGKQMPRWFQENETKLYNLGRVQGTIHLSAPFQPHAWPAGPLWIKLLPANTRHPERDDRREVEEFRGGFSIGGRGPHPKVLSIPFSFGTVLPGSYQLKVVWDKRPPYTDKEKPGPGDYESQLSAPFEVIAGQTISNLVAYCTNRVTLDGAQNYYAADDLRRAAMEKE